MGRILVKDWRGFGAGLTRKIRTGFVKGYNRQPSLYGGLALLAFALTLWALYSLAGLLWQFMTAPLGFLADSAGFAISQTLISYNESASYGRAFLVGLLNTLLVSGLAIIFATLIGFIVGIARLSSNWLVAKMATAYVEIIRNIPLLLQLFFWYFAVLRSLPHPRKSYAFADTFYLNNRGFFLPKTVFDPAMFWVWMTALLAIFAVYLFRKKNREHRLKTGQGMAHYWRWIAGLVALPFLIFLLMGLPLHLDFPVKGRFNLSGGLQISPEFSALFLALSLYTASYIAEIIRSGIQAVSKGQSEAAASLGLTQNQALKMVIIPQAMRIIIPPLTNQYMNTIKNSSLAVAIAYPDLVHVTMGATLSQTGKAVELVMMVMLVYLSLSLLTSFFMGWFNNRMSLVER